MYTLYIDLRALILKPSGQVPRPTRKPLVLTVIHVYRVQLSAGTNVVKEGVSVVEKTLFCLSTFIITTRLY